MSLRDNFQQLFAAGKQPGFEARMRFQMYTVFVALALPNMVGFGLLAVVRNSYFLAALLGACAIVLVAGWGLVQAGRDVMAVLTISGLVFGALGLHLGVVGGDGGSKILWLYSYPLVAVFLFGHRRGALWSGGLLLALLAFLWGHPFGIAGYPYPPDFVLRFIITYLVVTGVTMAFEYARVRYRDTMLREHAILLDERDRLNREIAERQRMEREREALIEQLQESLAQVKTLKGLVPICSSCHRIRDDRGFWNQLEAYISEHSAAQFSHGICPACREKLYPSRSDEAAE